MARRILIAAVVVLSPFLAAPGSAAAQVDVTPPELTVSQPHPDNFTFFQPLTPYFHGGVSDDVTAEPTVVIEISRHDDDTHAVVAERDLGAQSGGWDSPGYLWQDDRLEHGFEYDGTVTATDEAGNETVVVVTFYADGVTPRVGVEAPAQTQDSTVFVSGTASRDRGDIPFINVALTKPTKPQGSVGVVYVQAPVADDGTWSAELPEVQPGRYGLHVSHVDMAMNGTRLEQPLEVLPPPPPPPEAPPEEPPAPPPLPPALPPPFVDPGPAAALSLQRSALRALRAVRIGTLLTRGAKVRVATGAPGAAAADLVSGRAVLAKGRRTLDASGRGTVAVRVTAAGRRALRRARRMRMMVRVRFTPAGGATRTLQAPLTLKR